MSPYKDGLLDYGVELGQKCLAFGSGMLGRAWAGDQHFKAIAVAESRFSTTFDTLCGVSGKTEFHVRCLTPQAEVPECGVALPS